MYKKTMMSDTVTKKDIEINQELKDAYGLILWNDDVNSFDDVMDALIDICGHDMQQAEQCAMIAHYKGKCGIKSGEELNTLLGMKRSFDARKINTTVE